MFGYFGRGFGLYGGCGIGNYGAFNGNLGWMGFVGLGMHILFWIIIIFLVLIIVRRYKKNHQGSLFQFHQNDALNILRERYARGEISTEEYQEKRNELIK